ncbi:DNA (cytosine-5)-methyltransferase 1 [Cellulosimicrobium cellulans J34]|nr:DNA (cytosine-5)-methyltransferase 1 [Cellulosimicrobium cellulans J34]SMF54840.1 DNA (cytosine-5)-methyltransferase 1 [Cellulosimicrobium cellulans J1]
MDLVKSDSQLSVVDLFAGAGGLSAGLHQGSRRYTTVRAVEHDIAAAATYAQNFGDVVYAGDIQTWLRDEVAPEVDVVIGGPPCQGFSLIGKRDPADLRNSLWREYVEAVRRMQPRAFVMENVPAFLKTGEYDAFVSTFGSGDLANYEIQVKVLNAADFGSPQVRKRAIVVGVHRDLPHPGHPAGDLGTRTTVRQALEGVRPFTGELSLRPGRVQFRNAWLPGAFKGEELHITRPWSELFRARFRAIPYGGSRHDLPDELTTDCWRNNPTSASDVMGRLEWDKPAVTIRTEFFKPEKGRFLHPTQHRAITHWEAARLQGFSDDYMWVGDRAQIARQIGNAVPVQLGEVLGKHLAQVL